VFDRAYFMFKVYPNKVVVDKYSAWKVRSTYEITKDGASKLKLEKTFDISPGARSLTSSMAILSSSAVAALRH
jgi:hypothetical protein